MPSINTGLTPDSVPKMAIASTTSVSFANLRITIFGLQMFAASTLTCTLTTNGPGGLDTGSLAADALYYVYAVNNGGTLALIASLQAPSVGSAGGFTLARSQLVGAFYTNDASQSIVTVAIDGKPTTDWFSFATGSTFASGGFTRLPGSVNGAFLCRDGDSMGVRVDYTASGAATGTVIFSIPTTNTIDTAKISAASQAIGRAWTIIANSFSATPQLINSNTFQFRTDQGANGSVWGTAVPAAAWTAGSLVGIDVRVPIVGWSNTSLRMS